MSGAGYLTDGLAKLGAVTLFLGRLCGQCVPALARPRLVVAQVYNAGARSLIIIMLAGLFVGMVLGLQGYQLLRRFGSEEALGSASAIGLTFGLTAKSAQLLARQPPGASASKHRIQKVSLLSAGPAGP